MRDKHRGDVYFVVQAPQPGAQILAYLRVECAERFVEQQHLRVDSECAREGHPLARGRFGLREFRAAQHLAVVSPGTGHGIVEEVLARSGIERQVRLTVPHFVAVGHILHGTDLIATVPHRLAQRVTGPFGLVALPHPANLPEIAIHMIWHARVHRDPANQWLRGLVAECFADGGA